MARSTLVKRLFLVYSIFTVYLIVSGGLNTTIVILMYLDAVFLVLYLVREGKRTQTSPRP